MRNEERIWSLVDDRSGTYTALSDRIFDAPEIAYREFRAADEHAAVLEAEGFRVRRGVAGIPTAMIGEAGPAGGRGAGDRDTR